ncbi:amiloride-sensitive sodium channel subunit delta isoform X1 [Poecile atricapillus]|uniref:amiloride-sensitive sodium channel subunit delta isoform X1 n=1 Tax=Poecile atricapillus TaxID=48891 RepID=UPI0027384BA5|nr:amiloride-sensitive sodium channel subunit delta isoform X1 [Poecile atricapillus]XP_058711300.1 amiloride-sensitive sodium channel subunit delta isoform X1 [Poecile atricapillus]
MEPPRGEARQEGLIEFYGSFREMFEFFCKNTTIHGTIRLVCSSSNRMKTAFWTLLLLASFGMLYWQFGLMFRQFWAYPVVLTMSMHSEPKMFPAVTVCNLHPYRFELVSEHLEQLDQMAAESITFLYGINASAWLFRVNASKIHGNNRKIHGNNEKTRNKDGKIHENDRKIHENDRKIRIKDRKIRVNARKIRRSDRKIQESDRKIQESDRKIQDSDRKIQESDRKIHAQTLAKLNSSGFKLSHNFSLLRVSDLRAGRKHSSVGFRLCNSTGGNCFYKTFSSGMDAILEWYRFHYMNIMSQLPAIINISQHEEPIEDVVYSCQYNGEPCRPSDYDHFHHPVFGSCYTLNSKGTDPFWTATKPGIPYGLSLILRAEQKEHIPLLSTAAGVKVMIHSHNQTPFLEHEGFHIRPGIATTIGIQQDEVNRLGGNYGKCTTNGAGVAVELLYNSSYTLQACLHSCFQRWMLRECGCGYSRYPLPAGRARHCDYGAHPAWGHCFYQLYRRLRSHRLDCFQQCPKPCRESLYKVSAGTAKWPSAKSQVPHKTPESTPKQSWECSWAELQGYNPRIFGKALERIEFSLKSLFVLLNLISFTLPWLGTIPSAQVAPGASILFQFPVPTQNSLKIPSAPQFPAPNWNSIPSQFLQSHSNSFNPIPVPSIPSQFLQSHSNSFNPIPVPSIPSQFLQSHPSSFNPIPVPSIPFQFLQSHSNSFNPIQFPSIPFQFLQSHSSSFNPIPVPSIPFQLLQSRSSSLFPPTIPYKSPQCLNSQLQTGIQSCSNIPNIPIRNIPIRNITIETFQQ